MPPKRRVQPPPLVCFPRSSLDAAVYAPVDIVLKDLKVCTRRLQAVFCFFDDELKVLERIYYKGKNQHRSALFWRRAAGVRRCSQLLVGAGLSDIMEHLRCSFFGGLASQNLKLPRGPWTHCPSTDYVKFLLRRLSDHAALVDKMQERLLEAYRYFTLYMKSGSFVQLLLTLAAITSRMGILIPEIQDCISLALDACRRLLERLTPHQIPESTTESVFLNTEQSVMTTIPSQPSLLDEDVVDQDVGSSVSQITTHPYPLSLIPSQGVELLYPGGLAPSSSCALNGVGTGGYECRPPPGAQPSDVQEKVKGTTKYGSGLNKDKERKHSDEIDDIFASIC